MEAVLENNAIQRILVIDDEPESSPVKDLINYLTSTIGAIVDTAVDHLQCHHYINQSFYDFIILDPKANKKHNKYEFIDLIDLFPDHYDDENILGYSSFWGDLPNKEKKKLEERCKKHFSKNHPQDLYKYIERKTEYYGEKNSDKELNTIKESSIKTENKKNIKQKPSETILGNTTVGPMDKSESESMEKETYTLSQKSYYIGLIALIITILSTFGVILYSIGQVNERISADEKLRNASLESLKSLIENDKENRSLAFDKFLETLKIDSEQRKTLLTEMKNEIRTDKLHREHLFKEFQLSILSDNVERKRLLEQIDRSIADDRLLREQSLKQLEQISNYMKLRYEKSSSSE